MYSQEDELKDIIATARDMEARWGHLFDMIIINTDTERAYLNLMEEINSLEREQQWVPASWVHNWYMQKSHQPTTGAPNK